MIKSAASDEVVSVSDLMAMTGAVKNTGKSFHTLVDSVSRKVIDNVGQNPWDSVPMIYIKHRRLRGHSTVANNTVLSFDADGIARVPNMGYALADVENFIRSVPGVAEIIKIETSVPEPQPIDEPEVPVVVNEVSKEIQEVVLSEPESAPEEVAAPETVSDDTVQEPVTKKTPPKRHKPQ